MTVEQSCRNPVTAAGLVRYYHRKSDIWLLLLVSFSVYWFCVEADHDINYELLISKVCRQRSSSTEISPPLSPNSTSNQSASFSLSIDSLDSTNCGHSLVTKEITDLSTDKETSVTMSTLYTDALTMRVPSLELMEMRRVSLDSAMASHDQHNKKKPFCPKLVAFVMSE